MIDLKSAIPYAPYTQRYDINTGKQKIILNSRHKKGYFNTGVAVDESTGLFYLPDGYNMMSIKVRNL